MPIGTPHADEKADNSAYLTEYQKAYQEAYQQAYSLINQIYDLTKKLYPETSEFLSHYSNIIEILCCDLREGVQAQMRPTLEGMMTPNIPEESKILVLQNQANSFLRLHCTYHAIIGSGGINSTNDPLIDLPGDLSIIKNLQEILAKLQAQLAERA